MGNSPRVLPSGKPGAVQPWTNGQVERMNRTIKDATVKRFHYENHDQLRTHLADFMAAYNWVGSRFSETDLSAISG
jgi:hypothetical protein